MENVFDELREGRLDLDNSLLDLLFQGNESLHRLLSHASGRAEGDPQADALQVIDKIERYLGDHSTPAGVAFDDDSENPLESTLKHLSQSERQGIIRAARDGRTIAIVEATFPEQGFEEPFRTLLKGVRTWGLVHGTIPGEHHKEDSTFRIRLVASGEDVIFPLVKAASPLGGEVVTCDVQALLRQAEEEAEAPGPIELEIPETEPIPEEESAPESIAPVPEGQAPSESRAPRPLSSGTLRVPVERMDRLLSELANLMQAKMGLESCARGILATFTDRMQRTELTQSLRNLDRSVRALHDEVLRVRMVTLTSQFQRLERTVRETCRTTGRHARLVTSEEGVELDKRIVDALTEPLVHLVRNAVDHGLEDDRERKRTGKDPIGTVRIDAYPEGSYTVLEVSDDGGGINLDRVLSKGREVGLFPAHGTPTRSELLQAIFKAGFSVREEATEISGRGVGLDAVREAINGLGGLIDVDTGPTGTCFRLRLPTTLAITQGLLVEAGGQPFFLPLSAVMEVAKISHAQLERIHAEELILFDERGVAVRDLGLLLDLQPVDRDCDELLGVLIGLAERRLFLLVERLGGQQEIVVRSLGDLLPSIPGISGSTELGDGKTVLILDPSALFDLAHGESTGVEP
jgi:two-component system chemotaxis sensor kinase CheA